MRKIKKVKVTEMQEIVQDTLCNLCAKSLEHEISADNYGIVELVIYGGFYSPKLDDMTEYRFSLCEKCIHDKLFNKFKIPVEISADYTPGFVSITEKDKYINQYNKAAKKAEKEFMDLKE